MRADTAVITHKSRKFTGRNSVFLVLIITLIVSGGFCQIRQAMQTKAPISPLMRRAYVICNALSGSCESVSSPYFYNESIVLPDSKHGVRRIWSLSCQSAGRHTLLLINDTTNRVCCVFGETRGAGTNWNEMSLAAINTPEAAVDVSLQRLRQLEMLPPGAKFVLAEHPEKVRSGSAWQINWRVKRAGSETPTRIKIVLDRDGGYPLLATDYHEMQQFAKK